MKSLLLLPVGLMLRSYLALAFVMIYIQQQKAKRTQKKMAMAGI